MTMMASARPTTGATALGAELVYWREDGVHHTLVTIAGPLFLSSIGADLVDLTLAIHDVGGAMVTSWREQLRGSDTLFVDSRKRAAVDASSRTEGVLVIWVSAPTGSSRADAIAHPESYVRAYAMVDWFSDRGEVCCLHSDQSVLLPQRNAQAELTPQTISKEIELTEIVFEETNARRTYVVIANGPEAQAAEVGLTLVLRNHRGEERVLAYPKEMAPFSLHKIALAEITENLIAFCDGRMATMTGRFSAKGIFTRPYIMTEGEITAAYHGGNRYLSRSIPRLVHRTLSYAESAAQLASGAMPHEMLRVIAQKEMNPAYATHGPSLTTRVHLFQSHGDLEADYAIDVILYDKSGRIRLQRERCAMAPRRGAATLNIAELLDDTPFEGHIALSFSDSRSESSPAAQHDAFPGHLQALMEYRTDVSVARVMLWSDRWNAPDRLRAHEHPCRALCRVFMAGSRRTTLAITNPGMSADYDREAPYAIRLKSSLGDELVYRGTIAPHATAVASIDELFPNRPACELGTAIVESNFDLAGIHLTRDADSGVVAVEHLQPVFERVNGRLISPRGA